MKSKRLFLAVSLPDNAIRRLLAPLKSNRVNGVKPSPPEQLHITLRFLGDTSPERQAQIEEALKAMPSWQPFELTLEGAGLLPNKREPRVLSIGVRRSEELFLLKMSIDSLLEKAGVAPEEGKFRPHLTVARMKEWLSKDVSLGLPSLYEGMKPLTFPVSSFGLQSSALLQEGALYKLEASFDAAR